MGTIHSLLGALDERRIAQEVAIEHDESRMRYPLSSNTVRDFRQFSEVITDYYNYHHTACISHGGRLSYHEAYGQAKELLEREYRRQNGDIISCFNDAREGTNGGVRVILDMIADGLKARAIERYTATMFDLHVTPNSWEQKLDIISQFIGCCGALLSSSIVTSQPERYAHDYTELIKSYVEGLRRTSSIFRRL